MNVGMLTKSVSMCAPAFAEASANQGRQQVLNTRYRQRYAKASQNNLQIYG